MWTPPVLTLPGHQGTLGLRIRRVLMRMNPNDSSIPASSRNPARLPLEPRKSPESWMLPSADTGVLSGSEHPAPGADRTRVHGGPSIAEGGRRDLTAPGRLDVPRQPDPEPASDHLEPDPPADDRGPLLSLGIGKPAELAVGERR